MWHGAGAKPDAVRSLKQVKKGDRVLCYHSTPERSLYSIAEVTRDPYPDPHESDAKKLVTDLRALERLPRQQEPLGTSEPDDHQHGSEEQPGRRLPHR